MSSRSLTELRPEFGMPVSMWLADCAAAALDILVYCTFRSFAEQNQLYAQGRTTAGARVTNAKGGESAHNYGLALDFVPLVQGKAQWKAGNPLYRQAIALAEKRGL